jgi:putative ABC transport system permease protein
VRAGNGSALGSKVTVTGVTGDVGRVISIKWKSGGPRTPELLGLEGAFVSKDYANANHLHAGSPVSLKTPNGAIVPLTIRGVYEPPKGSAAFGDVTISTTRFDQLYSDPQNVFTFIDMKGGVSAANTHALQSALSGFPDAKLQTKSQFKHNQLQGLTLLLNLLYVLLSLSIIVSLFGIVNTLVLTVFERTRELGMLRAVGMTRGQIRRMVRHESVITALLGAAFGIPIGVVLALMVGVAIKYAAFTVPIGTLVVFVIAAIIAGLVAAIFPARRAARLNVLAALQYE